MIQFNNESVRPIAFYLPQYHPIPENDKWWGKGFTEWANVVKATPRFTGHYQPHLPADLGFYDLRLSETREAQADLAKQYGIYGFCYYHYWFNGKRLLERPFNEVLQSGKPDFPFCLCWANENWSRRWDGSEKEILIKQVHSDEDDFEHIRWLAKAFCDPRYIKVDGKPLFLIYKASLLPNVLRTTQVWREEARRLGIGELFLCNVESNSAEYINPNEFGFDAAVEFQPRWSALAGLRLRDQRFWYWSRKLKLTNMGYGENMVFDYKETVKRMLSLTPPNYLRFPCVTPSWDNSARRKREAYIFHDSRPQYYEHWLRETVKCVKTNPSLNGILFINAWNEWAEGNHLEPCNKWGYQYLEATKKAIS